MANLEIKFKKVRDNGRTLIKNIRYYDSKGTPHQLGKKESSLLIKDLHKKLIPVKKVENKYVICDPEIVLRYIPKSPVVKANNNYKNVIFNKYAIITLALLIIRSIDLGLNDSKNSNFDKVNSFEHNVHNNDEENKDISAILQDINNASKMIYDSQIINVNEIKQLMSNYHNFLKNYKDNIISSILNEETNTNVFQISTENRSDSQHIVNIEQKYGNIIEKYSKEYGIDYKLVVAIIAQENPTNKRNDRLIGGYGLMQVESIWNGNSISAYNFETNQIDKVTISTSKMNDDPEYSIKVGCMIFNNQYQILHDKYCIKTQKLTETQCVIAALYSYNKGITCIENAIKNSNDFNTFLDMVRDSKGGDNKYIEHVLSFLQDGTQLKIKNTNTIYENYDSGYTTTITIDNENCDIFKI